MRETESEAAAEAREVSIPAGRITLEGHLDVPREPRGIVLFAHGTGSSRHSRRNQFVARHLQESGLATLLMDLLTADEEAEDARTARLRFDMDLLARRLIAAMDWLGQDARIQRLPVGLFGASSGGGAALVAAAERPPVVKAVVSRGGRPDLAGDALPRVQAPTLLIVGSRDTAVIEMNRQAFEQLRCVKDLVIVPGASHLFEEPGTLEAVATHAAAWFSHHLEAEGPR
jgi:putative phosphoribosyl transferase